MHGERRTLHAKDYPRLPQSSPGTLLRLCVIGKPLMRRREHRKFDSVLALLEYQRMMRDNTNAISDEGYSRECPADSGANSFRRVKSYRPHKERGGNTP